MSGGNIQAGVFRKRLINQVFITRITTGESLGSEQEPYTASLLVASWYEQLYQFVTPWPASLAAITSVAQTSCRVVSGSLKILVAYRQHSDGGFSGWDWGPQDCTVTPSTMQGVEDRQWDSWTFANGVYTLPAKAAVCVQASLINCKLGDGTLARWQASIVLEPTRS
jgi:hypothetical protein